MPGVGRRGDQPVAGVADAGHAGIGHEQDIVSGGQLGEQARDALTLDVVVVRQHPACQPHAERRSEPAQAPGVFGRDHLSRRERAREPGRGVTRLADRDSRDRQRAARLAGAWLSTAPPCRGLHLGYSGICCCFVASPFHVPAQASLSRT